MYSGRRIRLKILAPFGFPIGVSAVLFLRMVGNFLIFLKLAAPYELCNAMTCTVHMCEVMRPSSYKKGVRLQFSGFLTGRASKWDTDKAYEFMMHL